MVYSLRLARVLAMVLLILLASCSSVPQFSDDGNRLAEATRNLIASNEQFRKVTELAAKENKHIDWSRATETLDGDGRTIVQLPIWFDQRSVELIVVSIEHSKVSAVFLSRIMKEQNPEAVQFVFTDLSSNSVVAGQVRATEGKPILEKLILGRSQGVSSITELTRVHMPDVINLAAMPQDPQLQQTSCSDLLSNLALAALGVTIATRALSACFPFPFTPACGLALAGYAVALVAYYSALDQARRAGCI